MTIHNFECENCYTNIKVDDNSKFTDIRLGTVEVECPNPDCKARYLIKCKAYLHLIDKNKESR